MSNSQVHGVGVRHRDVRFSAVRGPSLYSSCEPYVPQKRGTFAVFLHVPLLGVPLCFGRFAARLHLVELIIALNSVARPQFLRSMLVRVLVRRNSG